jgi:ATPase subunit of ABC transporter with duplicated ATPase domains
MVAGAVAPDAGSIQLGASLKMGYFAQQALDLLDPDLTIEEQLQRDFPNESIGVLRNLAGAFQFSGDDIDKKIRALSGGEKTRLVMARMLLDPPNFLVLDEPTNHLDLATKQMLVEALGGIHDGMRSSSPACTVTSCPSSVNFSAPVST